MIIALNGFIFEIMAWSWQARRLRDGTT